jgi:hypothetical protein
MSSLISKTQLAAGTVLLSCVHGTEIISVLLRMSKDKNEKVTLINWKEIFERFWLLFVLICLNSACYKMVPVTSDLSPFCTTEIGSSFFWFFSILHVTKWLLFLLICLLAACHDWTMFFWILQVTKFVQISGTNIKIRQWIVVFELQNSVITVESHHTI